MKINHDPNRVRSRVINQRDFYRQTCNTKSTLMLCRNEHIIDPYITICIPTYKRYEGLKKSVESVMNQKHCSFNYSLIIIDNDPDINETQIFDFITKVSVPANCSVYYYKNENNIGMLGNWNKCVELAKTKYIAMLHDDDIIFDDYLVRIQIVLRRYSKKNVGYIRCNGDQIYNGINVNTHHIRNRLKELFKYKLNKVSKIDCVLSGSAGGLGSPTCGSIINREALISVKGYNPDFYPTSDCYPPYLMIGCYDVYTTVSSFGAKFFGENESVKIETMWGWLKELLYFQQFLATESRLSRAIISFFGDEQYSNFIHIYLKGLLELGHKDFKEGMFDDIYKSKANPFKNSLLKIACFLRIYYTYVRTLLIG